MLDLRKFPLFHALIPFLIGLLLSYAAKWPVTVCLSFFAFLLLMTFIIWRSKPGYLQLQPVRTAFAGILWFAFGLLVFSTRDFRTDAKGIHPFLNREVVVSGEIREVKQGIGGKQQLLLAAEQVFTSDSVVSCRGKVLVNVMDDEQVFHCGEVIVLDGGLLPVTALNNPGEFDAVAFYESRKVGAYVFTSGQTIVKTGERTSLNSILTGWRDFLAGNMEQHLDGTFLAISKALILGDKSDLDAETMNAFSTTGSMHVLAVSGLHIGLILLLFQRVLGIFSRWITKRQGILLAIVLIWIYGGITGASPAVMRAVVMFSILSGAQLFRRQSHPMNVLGFSAIALLCFDPWMLFDLGFQLSYAAMLGIFLLYRPIVDVWAPHHPWVKATWEGTAVGLAATVITTPLILLWFYQFPNYFALANLGVLLFGFLVLMMGLVFLFTGWIPYLVKIVAVVFAFTIFGLVFWVEWVDSLPGAVSGGFQLTVWEVVAAYVLIAGWILHLHWKRGRRLWLMLGTLLLIGWWTAARFQVLQTREWVVFNSNQFVAAVKVENEVYGVYDRKWNGSWKVPRELESYAKFTGSKLHLVRLYHHTTQLRVGNDRWKFLKQKDGIHIKRQQNSWFYRTGGTPDASEPRALMTTRLQLYADPQLPTGPFRMRY